MNPKTTLLLCTGWSLLALAGPVRGQEVNSDVKIPPPRELVAATSAISGMSMGTGALFTSEDQLFSETVAQAALGRLSESETRDELGDFMTSLLVRVGIITFDRPGAALASSPEKPQDLSFPAWTGPTPIAFSVSRAGRGASMRRR